MGRIVDFDRTQPHSFCGTGGLGTPWKPGDPDGCGEPVFFDRPFPDMRHTAIRCADCFAVFCLECAKEHFRTHEHWRWTRVFKRAVVNTVGWTALGDVWRKKLRQGAAMKELDA